MVVKKKYSLGKIVSVAMYFGNCSLTCSSNSEGNFFKTWRSSVQWKCGNVSIIVWTWTQASSGWITSWLLLSGLHWGFRRPSWADSSQHAYVLWRPQRSCLSNTILSRNGNNTLSPFQTRRIHNGLKTREVCMAEDVSSRVIGQDRKWIWSALKCFSHKAMSVISVVTA